MYVGVGHMYAQRILETDDHRLNRGSVGSSRPSDGALTSASRTRPASKALFTRLAILAPRSAWYTKTGKTTSEAWIRASSWERSSTNWMGYGAFTVRLATSPTLRGSLGASAQSTTNRLVTTQTTSSTITRLASPTEKRRSSSPMRSIKTPMIWLIRPITSDSPNGPGHVDRTPRQYRPPAGA